MNQARRRTLGRRDGIMAIGPAEIVEPSKDARQGLGYGLGRDVAV